MASPPAALIWLTMSCAGVVSEPSPVPLVPGSLTTTLAPFAAINFATSPPTPRPEPVQIATRPSSMPMAAALSRMSFGSAVDPAPAGFVNSAGRRQQRAAGEGTAGPGEFEASTTQDCSARGRLLHLQEICSKNPRNGCALAAKPALS